jgi:hypothetical protein
MTPIQPIRTAPTGLVVACLATLVLTLAACGATPPTDPAAASVRLAVPTSPPPTAAPSQAPTTTTPSVAPQSPAAAAAGQPKTIHVLEDPVDFTHVLVGSLTGCTTASTTGCQGDQLIGRSRLLDAATHAEVGRFLVSCFLVDPGQSLYTCPANTITLTGRGQIVFTESLLFREASAKEWEDWAPWPITGGTGEFLGATGTVDGPKDSTWSYGDFVITIAK